MCSKIMEHIIYSGLFDHLNHFQVLWDEQHGFHQHRRCGTQLISTVHDFALCLNQRRQRDVLLLNFCKSLTPISWVNYNFMVFLRWMKNFLTNGSHQMIIDNKWSDSYNVLSVVPQGTVLTLLLFLIYINDLPLHVSNKVAFLLMMLFCICTSIQWMTAADCKNTLTPSHSGHISGKCTRKCEFLTRKTTYHSTITSMTAQLKGLLMPNT